MNWRYGDSKGYFFTSKGIIAQHSLLNRKECVTDRFDNAVNPGGHFSAFHWKQSREAISRPSIKCWAGCGSWAKALRISFSNSRSCSQNINTWGEKERINSRTKKTKKHIFKKPSSARLDQVSAVRNIKETVFLAKFLRGSYWERLVWRRRCWLWIKVGSLGRGRDEWNSWKRRK